MDLNSLLWIMVFWFALFCFVMDQKPDSILTKLSIASIRSNFSMEGLKDENTFCATFSQIF